MEEFSRVLLGSATDNERSVDLWTSAMALSVFLVHVDLSGTSRRAHRLNVVPHDEEGIAGSDTDTIAEGKIAGALQGGRLEEIARLLG